MQQVMWPERRIGQKTEIRGGLTYELAGGLTLTQDKQESGRDRFLRRLREVQTELSAIRRDLRDPATRPVVAVGELLRDLPRARSVAALADRKVFADVEGLLRTKPRAATESLLRNTRKLVDRYRRLMPPESRSI